MRFFSEAAQGIKELHQLILEMLARRGSGERSYLRGFISKVKRRFNRGEFQDWQKKTTWIFYNQKPKHFFCISSRWTSRAQFLLCFLNYVISVSYESLSFPTLLLLLLNIHVCTVLGGLQKFPCSLFIYLFIFIDAHQLNYHLFI